MPPPRRVRLAHVPPPWVPSGSPFFVTLCAADRRGAPILAPGVPAALLDAVTYYHASHQWHCELALVMPDHLHAVLAVPATHDLAHLVPSWKCFTARRLGLHWQRNFFDHRLRSAAEHEEKLRYIRLNPVRAGLVATTEDWPWQWQPTAPPTW